MRMKANFLFILFSLFMLQNVLAMNTNYWTQRFNDKNRFRDDLKTILKAFSIHELVNMIDRVRALELEKKLEEEKQKRLREEERRKKEREEEMRVAKIKSFIESHFGRSSFLKDFNTNLMM